MLRSLFVGLSAFMIGMPISGCQTSLSGAAKENRIRVVTHPQMVDGMEFVHGYTTGKTMQDIEGAGNAAANDAAQSGLRDVTVLIETNSVGIDLYTYKVGIYRLKPTT